MSQNDIFNFVRRERKWLSNKQISKKMNVSYASITVATRKLTKSGFFKTKERIVDHRHILFFKYEGGRKK